MGITQLINQSWDYNPNNKEMGGHKTLSTIFEYNGLQYHLILWCVDENYDYGFYIEGRKKGKFDADWVEDLSRMGSFKEVTINRSWGYARWHSKSLKALLHPLQKFGIMPPQNLVNKLQQSKRRSNKKSLQELAKKLPPRDIKVGDYVEVQASKIDDLFNARQIRDIAKKTMNILYVYKLERGMLTVTPGRGVTHPKVQIPLNCSRYKLTNVE